MTDQTKPALPTLAEIEAMEVLLGRATPGPLWLVALWNSAPSLLAAAREAARAARNEADQNALLDAAGVPAHSPDLVVPGDGDLTVWGRIEALIAERDALREELARVKAENDDILTRIGETELVYDEAYETLKRIMKDYEVGPWAEKSEQAETGKGTAPRAQE